MKKVKNMPQPKVYLSPIFFLCVLFLIIVSLGYKDQYEVGIRLMLLISGYLAADYWNFRSEVDTGVFRNFIHPLVRRVLLPVVGCAVLTLIISGFLLSKNAFSTVAWGALSTLFFVSNINTWINYNFLSSEQSINLMQHTWIISLVAQMWLIYVAIVTYLSRDVSRKVLYGIYILLLITGMKLGVYWQTFESYAVFYLPPFRFFEFFTGILAYHFLSFLPEIPRKHSILLVFVSIILLAVIFFHDSLSPMLSSVLILLAGVGVILGCRGAISPHMYHFSKWSYEYSLALYLSVYPIYELFRIYFESDSGPRRKFAIVLCSLFFSFFLFFGKKIGSRFIESHTKIRCIYWEITVTIMTIFFLAHIIKHDGWPWRAEWMGNPSTLFMSARSKMKCEEGYGYCPSIEKSSSVIIGDREIVDQYSHLLGLWALEKKQTISEGYISADCLPIFDGLDKCSVQMESQLTTILSSRLIERVILAGNWITSLRRDSWEKKNQGTVNYGRWKLEVTIEKLAAAGKKVTVLGVIPALKSDPTQCFSTPIKRSSCEYFPAENISMQYYLNHVISNVVKNSEGNHYIDLFSLMCNENGICKAGDTPYSFYDGPMNVNSINIGAYVISQHGAAVF